jgi:hypothetical protein
MWCKFILSDLSQWRSFSVASFTCGSEVLRGKAGTPTSLGEEISAATRGASVPPSCLIPLSSAFTTLIYCLYIRPVVTRLVFRLSIVLSWKVDTQHL